MDIILQQQYSLNSKTEEDILCIVNETLQHLITEVEILIRNTEFRSSSEWTERYQNIDYKNEFISQQPNQSIEAKKDRPAAKDQDSLERSHEFENRFSQQPVPFAKATQIFSQKDDLLRSLESNNSASVEPTANPQADTSARVEPILHGNKHESSSVDTKCRIGSSVEKPDYSIKEGNIFFPDSQEDFSRSAEWKIDINSGQPDSNASEVHQSLENDQAVDLLNEDFTDALENSEDIDVVGGSNENSDQEEFSNKERVSPISTSTLSSIENLSDNRTESNSEGSQMMIVDWFENDEGFEDFANAALSDEIGDQDETGDLNDIVFLERIVRFVRETDMILIANHGAGDTIYDSDDDDEDDVVV